jgi:hypothetical protein
MPKKRKTATSAKKTATKKTKSIDEKLLENFIQLQKVNTDLAEKFDKLTKEISQLLSLFELAARSFSKHPSFKPSEKDNEFLGKIDKLLEQNKTIAKGLTLMEEKVKQNMYSPAPRQSPQTHSESEFTTVNSSKKPLPRF